MCGIAGMFGAGASQARVARMVEALRRRGPDDSGVWMDAAQPVALGHARLSIIDLSPAGHQPMTHGDGRYWITFNGEIYNYLELRQELEQAGVVFATHTDTEVILASWARWGMDCARRFRGMFAFAMWDRQMRRLDLVRDRLGIKPLLWCDTPQGFVFASELKALLASGAVDPVVEPQAVCDLLAVGAVRQPGTAIRGVQALAPGTVLSIDGAGRRTVTRYWDLAGAAAQRRPDLARLSYGESVQLVRGQLEEACRYHLIADVPVGSFLSGGIDSTAVTAIMARQMATPVRSFSVGFENTGDVAHELDAARLAAEHIGCEHTEVMLTGRDVAEAFDDLVRVIDQPSHDGTNTYFVSRAARRSVTVALSGLGGDELFAGYPHFALLARAGCRSAGPVDRLTGRLHRLRPNRWTLASAWRVLPPAGRYALLRRVLADGAVREALAGPLREAFRPGFVEDGIASDLDPELDSVAQTTVVECHQYLLHTLLRDADSMSMGHGLEVRPILLDHVLAEIALALPATAKVRSGRFKAVLKDAVRDLLPPSLLTRRKTGFTLPMGTWLRTELRERLRAELASPDATAFFAPAFLAEHLRRLDDPAATYLHWTLLVFLAWVREHRLRPGS